MLGALVGDVLGFMLGRTPDYINSGFIIFVAIMWLRSARYAIRNEDIAEKEPIFTAVYCAWSIFSVFWMLALGYWASAALFMALGAAQAIFLLLCFIYCGTFNFDRRRDRVRWKLITTIRHMREPRAKHAELPWKWCQLCGDETRHDLDGHCMICDSGPWGADEQGERNEHHQGRREAA